MKYKEGTRVRIKEDLIPNKYYSDVFFNPEMCWMRGRIFTIKLYQKGILHTKGVYCMKEENDWIFSEDMFDVAYEKIKEEDL